MKPKGLHVKAEGEGSLDWRFVEVNSNLLEVIGEEAIAR